jgi:polyisoprenoid-binding protein YceI
MDLMVVRVLGIALAVIVALIAVGAYAVFKPAPEASVPIESVALDAPPATADTAATRRFEIQPGESQARFVIDEVLQGSPKTVVGSTNQVAGQIALDPTDLDTAEVGTILINARTLTTDSEQRNRMLQNRILETGDHEYISFQPKQLIGLPDGAVAGQTVPIQIVGDLTIKGITREVTFDATVTPASTDRLQGSAATTIRYADWGISIPQVPAVAGVADVAQLQIDFVATQVTG